ncbi:MAG: hypothetical protein LBR34_09975 [Prevotella sp.]|jgi:hypothetical protein|nr:hypothetical protein [Prevotella sp.]
MNKLKKILALFPVAVFMLSCSEPTMEEDAQKAAYLYNLSREHSANKQFEEAAGDYMEVQKIIDKYRYTEKFQHFCDIYNLYLRNYLEEAAESVELAKPTESAQ